MAVGSSSETLYMYNFLFWVFKMMLSCNLFAFVWVSPVCVLGFCFVCEVVFFLVGWFSVCSVFFVFGWFFPHPTNFLIIDS